MLSAVFGACARLDDSTRLAAPNFDTRDDIAIGFVAKAPACAVVERGSALDLEYFASESVSVVAQDERGGLAFVLAREVVPVGRGILTIPTTGLAAGTSTLRIAAFAADRQAFELSFSLLVRTPVDGAALTDADGDCFSPRLGDCNDESAAQHPGAVEICGDGVDADCDGLDGC